MMQEAKQLRSVRLRISKPRDLVNNIAGTYETVYKALMEYVDNAADAAVESMIKGHLVITIDNVKGEVAFFDDCGGMSPDELGRLLENIGDSTKEHRMWIKGQFGFGVHAFRGFARYAEFITRKKGYQSCRLIIDRNSDHDVDVPVTSFEWELGEDKNGTMVKIYGFNQGVFKRKSFASKLRETIEENFDEVINNGILEVKIRDGQGSVSEPCVPVNIASLEGSPIIQEIPVKIDGNIGSIKVNLKVIEGSTPRQRVSLTRNSRRILTIGDLTSFRNHLKRSLRTIDVWNEPHLTGAIEIGHIANTNISRNDLQPGNGRDLLYEELEHIQSIVESKVKDYYNKRRDRQLDAVSEVLSERLTNILKRFKTKFLKEVIQPKGAETGGSSGIEVMPGGTDAGGNGIGDVPGAGGQRNDGGGGDTPRAGGIGSGSSGATIGGGGKEGAGKSTLARSGPTIEFHHLEPQIRCQLVGSQITVNTDNPDFKQRSPRAGEIDEKLLFHIARIISPELTLKVYTDKGEIPTPKEFADRSLDLNILIENDFAEHEEDIALAAMNTNVSD